MNENEKCRGRIRVIHKIHRLYECLKPIVVQAAANAMSKCSKPTEEANENVLTIHNWIHIYWLIGNMTD